MISLTDTNGHRRLKVALVADDLTRECLALECSVMSVTPWSAPFVFSLWRPDLLFVESSWKGLWESWRYKIAAYPDHPDRSNDALRRVVRQARDRNIPAVFWNREDGVHFDRFIDSAKLFNKVLTVDESKLADYRAALGDGARVDVMPFAVSPSMHHPAGGPTNRRAAFVGSYGQHVHPERRQWQDEIFEATSDLGLTIYDRNSDRRSNVYRFPDRSWIEVRRAIPHAKTADVYRQFIANINVNTITDSRTAYSRRLVEILACGGLAVTNTTPAVEELFADFCECPRDKVEAHELFTKLARDGRTRRQQEKASAGSAYVIENHSWHRRLQQIIEFAGL